MSGEPDREALRDRILEEALELSGEARRRFVGEQCGGDAEMAAEIERLLGHESELGGGFLETPATLEQTQSIVGMRIGRYAVEAQIGAGGAGRVYRARDVEIQRRVALKVLHADGTGAGGRERFLRELKMLGAINHENVVQLYDFGEHEGSLYLVLEYLQGEDLSHAIPAGRCGDLAARVEIGRQIVAGLAHIHEAGIIHRDLKPANLFLLPSGRVKLMDFGIARAQGLGLTVAGQVAGTPAYMAPEQLEKNSDELTAQVDVHALGITLYELFTGRRAFDGDTMGRVLSQVRSQPVSVETMRAAGVSEALCGFVAQCAAKDPAARPVKLVEAYAAAAGGVGPRVVAEAPVMGASRRRVMVAVPAGLGAAALGGVAYWAGWIANRGAGIRSVAVLPFRNGTGSEKYEYLATGLTEGLITSLGYVRGLMVTARAAVLAYQNKNVDPREAGARLGVDGVIVGSVGLRAGAFAVSAELADTVKAARLWGAEQVFREEEIAQAQGSIAAKVAAALQLKPGESGQQAFAQQTRSGGAYQDYLYGRYAMNKRTLAGYRQAAEYFQKAVDADGKFAQAWAGLADAWSFQGGLRPPREVFPLAKQAVEQGLRANPAVAEVHASAGFIHLQYDWDWPGAEREFQAALAVNENDSTARVRYARLLLVMGRFAEAERELLRVQKLDPVSLTTGTTLANCYYLNRRFDAALRQLGKVLELEAGFMVALDLQADVLLEVGRFGEAMAIYEKEVESQPEDAGALASLVRAAAMGKDLKKRDAAVERFRKLAAARPVNPTAAAMVEIALGYPDKAMDALQEGFRQRYWPLIFLKVSPLWDSLRGRVDFQNLVRAMNLA